MKDCESKILQILESFDAKAPVPEKPRILKTRLTDHVVHDRVRDKDFIFPPDNLLSYDNPIAGFTSANGELKGFNIIMKDGNKTNYKPYGG